MRVAHRLQAILLPVLQRPVVKTAAHSQPLALFIKRHQRRYQHIQLCSGSTSRTSSFGSGFSGDSPPARCADGSAETADCRG
jgi:hypothetical protein